MNKTFSGNEAPAHNTISIVLQKVISSGFPFFRKEKKEVVLIIDNDTKTVQAVGDFVSVVKSEWS